MIGSKKKQQHFTSNLLKLVLIPYLLECFQISIKIVFHAEKNDIMRKIFFVTFCIIFTVIATSSDIYGQNSVRKIPGKYLMPMDNASAAMPGSKNKDGELWVVFSDRNSNPLFSDKACKSVVSNKKMEFMHPMYVIDETEDAIKVVEINDADMRGNLKDGAASRGCWVKKDNMLLWRTCLKTRDVKLPEFKDGIFNKKAMVLNIIKGNQQTINVPLYYSHPRCSRPDSTSSALVYQITYVYKETADAYLLGDMPQISNVTKDLDNIRGWVRKNQTSAWNHRLAYEINWDPQAVSERKSKGVKAKITSSASSSSATITQEPSSYYTKRAIGEIDRYPVLDVTNGVSKVGVIGDLRAENGKTISNVEFAEIQHVIDSMSIAVRNVNVIFVIDATSSMIPYSKAIQDAIKNAMRDLMKSKNSYKFGLLLYRDATEANIVAYTRDLSPNVTQINNHINKYMTPSFNKCNNDNEEAVFYGMKKAIERFDPPAGESNFMILVGDAGNHSRKTVTNCAGKTQSDPTYIEQSEIVDLLAKKNINLMAYQVHHQVTSDARPAYDNFRTQVSSIMKEVAEKRAGNTPDSRVLVQKSKSTFEINKNTGTFGIFSQAPDGGSMHPTTLTKELRGGLEYIDKSVDNYLDAISLYVNGKLSGNDVKQLSGFIKKLHQQRIPTDKLDIVFQKRGQVYTTGYTRQTEPGMKNPTYQSVLLMSHDDLFAIKKSLERLVPTDQLSLPPNESRSFIFYSWGEILVDFLGYFPEANEAIDTLSLYSLSAILTGWGGKEKFKDIRLMDVVDPVKFPDVMLYEYLIDWCITKGHIQSIYDGQNLLTADFYEDHKYTIFAEYLYHLTKGKVEDDPEVQERFANYFKKYDNEYNNYKASFRIPVGTGAGMKHYWIDSRIFPHNSKEFGEKDITEVLFPKYVK